MCKFRSALFSPRIDFSASRPVSSTSVSPILTGPKRSCIVSHHVGLVRRLHAFYLCSLPVIQSSATTSTTSAAIRILASLLTHFFQPELEFRFRFPTSSTTSSNNSFAPLLMSTKRYSALTPPGRFASTLQGILDLGHMKGFQHRHRLEGCGGPVLVGTSSAGITICAFFLRSLVTR